MPDCYAIVSGSYSDYQVHVVFESEDDAKAYAQQMGRADLRRTHDSIVDGRQKYLVSAGSGPANPHQGEFDTCPLCVKLLADRAGYGSHPYEVTRFDYWPEGTLPVSFQESRGNDG